MCVCVCACVCTYPNVTLEIVVPIIRIPSLARRPTASESWSELLKLSSTIVSLMMLMSERDSQREIGRDRVRETGRVRETE